MSTNLSACICVCFARSQSANGCICLVVRAARGCLCSVSLCALMCIINFSQKAVACLRIIHTPLPGGYANAHLIRTRPISLCVCVRTVHVYACSTWRRPPVPNLMEVKRSCKTTGLCRISACFQHLHCHPFTQTRRAAPRLMAQ